MLNSNKTVIFKLESRERQHLNVAIYNNEQSDIDVAISLFTKATTQQDAYSFEKY